MAQSDGEDRRPSRGPVVLTKPLSRTRAAAGAARLDPAFGSSTRWEGLKRNSATPHARTRAPARAREATHGFAAPTVRVRAPAEKLPAPAPARLPGPEAPPQPALLDRLIARLAAAA